ncbi:hypothetical protein [Rhodopirellula islandica]|uniref:hypothetical protein n=1 Tax=Rhodopirellula islandica TaxID=595434 RepID=UPI00064AFBAB|nr:hypothetical protein [Rhodopirellula islandica]
MLPKLLLISLVCSLPAHPSLHPMQLGPTQWIDSAALETLEPQSEIVLPRLVVPEWRRTLKIKPRNWEQSRLESEERVKRLKERIERAKKQQERIDRQRGIQDRPVLKGI